MSAYRPLGIRIATIAAAVSLTVFAVVVWFALPASIQATFTAEQWITIALAVLAAAAVLHGLARSSVRTDEGGVVVVNGYRSHRVPWEQVASVGLGRGAPWAVLETVGGDSMMVMAVQSADGDRARSALLALRREVAAHR